MPAPEHLNWDLWLGTAAVRPYAPEVYHPLIWRVWRDLGSGWIGDIGCHLMSAVWKGMSLGKAAPRSVVAETQTNAEDNVKDIVWPTATHITWKFAGVPASGGKPFEWEWFDGCSEPDNLSPAQFRPPAEVERLFEQTPAKKRPHEGKAIKCRDGWILQPHAKDAAYVVRNDGKPMKAPQLPAVPSHYHEFVDACLEGRKASTDFDWTTWMMETILAGEIAERVSGTKLAWDPKNRVFDCIAANAFLKSSYRKGWEIDVLS